MTTALKSRTPHCTSNTRIKNSTGQDLVRCLKFGYGKVETATYKRVSVMGTKIVLSNLRISQNFEKTNFYPEIAAYNPSHNIKERILQNFLMSMMGWTRCVMKWVVYSEFTNCKVAFHRVNFVLEGEPVWCCEQNAIRDISECCDRANTVRLSYKTYGSHPSNHAQMHYQYRGTNHKHLNQSVGPSVGCICHVGSSPANALTSHVFRIRTGTSDYNFWYLSCAALVSAIAKTTGAQRLAFDG